MAKKLKVEDIPEGYNYAAVDYDGYGVAYKEKPFLADGDNEWSCYTNDFKKIGSFDTSDWQNSLVSRKAAERLEVKKLTPEDIPGGYTYAAVNSNGKAYAFEDEPEPKYNGTWNKCFNGKMKFIGNFDGTDWKNSLVPSESNEPETAYKETENKLSYSEIDPYFLEQMARRMQKGKEKYGPNNWKKLSDINELLDAAQRHLIELRKMVQEDFEPLPGQESEAQHCAALACNAMFIHYHLNPNT